MANEYIALSVYEADGRVALSKNVVETIAILAINELSDVKVVDRTTLKAHPVVCKITDGELFLNIDVKIKYYSNINDVCRNAQMKVEQLLSELTGLSTTAIDIRVVGFLF